MQILQETQQDAGTLFIIASDDGAWTKEYFWGAPSTGTVDSTWWDHCRNEALALGALEFSQVQE